MLKLAAGLLFAATLAAPAPTVTGTWNMGLQGDHVIPVALVLKQDGKTVTGTIALPTQRGDRVEVGLSGEFVDSALKLSGKVENAAEPTTITIEATLNEDGALEGTMAGVHRKMPFTAERLKERK